MQDDRQERTTGRIQTAPPASLKVSTVLQLASRYSWMQPRRRR